MTQAERHEMKRPLNEAGLREIEALLPTDGEGRTIDEVLAGLGYWTRNTLRTAMRFLVVQGRVTSNAATAAPREPRRFKRAARAEA